MAPGRRLYLRWRVSAIFYAVVVFAMVSAFYAREPWKEERFRRQASKDYNLISEALRRELTSSENVGWGGTYFANRKDGLLMALTIGENSGWIFESVDNNGRYDRNYGQLLFDESANSIHLMPTFRSQYLPKVLYPMRMGRASFLIGPTEMPDFLVANAQQANWTTAHQSEYLIRKE